MKVHGMCIARVQNVRTQHHGQTDQPSTALSQSRCTTLRAQPNYLLPWQMNRQEACSGSAFFIESNDQKMLLTNAHVVRDYTTVRVRRHGGSHKFEAKVRSLLVTRRVGAGRWGDGAMGRSGDGAMGRLRVTQSRWLHLQ